MQVYLQLQEPQAGQMKALKSNLEKARELKNAQGSGGGQGGADKGQQQMIMELYQKCAQLKVSHSWCGWECSPWLISAGRSCIAHVI